MAETQTDIYQRVPATTPQARENQLISLAMDRAEEQLVNGTATSQIIVHFLQLATEKEKLQREKLRTETELTRIKTDSIKSQQRTEEMYEEALKAMKEYSGS